MKLKEMFAFLYEKINKIDVVIFGLTCLVIFIGISPQL